MPEIDVPPQCIPPGQGVPEEDFNIPPGQGLPPADPPPAITALNPNTAPANADVIVNISGTGFSGNATVNIGIAHSLVPTSITPTDLSVLVKAVNIAAPGVLPVSVTNVDGQVSNAIDFTAT